MVAQSIVSQEQTGCVVVGGGPAGVLLTLLLGRSGVRVTLLEEHLDFDRDFRGDTVHPSTLDILDEIGLADRMLATLPHSKLSEVANIFDIDFAGIGAKYPFIAMIPQAVFLDFLAKEARKYPHVTITLGARAEALLMDGERVSGISYRTSDGMHELRAPLVVAADGRFSRIRKLAGITPRSTSPTVDVLWFRVPRLPEETAGLQAAAGPGRAAVMLNRVDEWQIAYIIPKHGYAALKERGLDAFRQSLREIMPALGERIETLQQWKQIAVLSVESNMVDQWYRPGLLLIGDAAHTMSPIGGIGINYAIHDAVETANLLAAHLRRGEAPLSALAAVQRRRKFPTQFIQFVQTQLQHRIVEPILASTDRVGIPWFLPYLARIPHISRIPARVMGYGLRPAHVQAT